MSENTETMLQSVRKFVTKYRNNGFDFKPNPTRKERQTLNELALTVHGFEVVEQPQLKPDLSTIGGIPTVEYNLNKMMVELNRAITLATFQGLLPDNLTLQKLADCEEAKKTLDSELKISKSVIDQLREEKAYWKAKADLYTEYYPPPKIPVESEVKEEDE